ncbi:J domain-containing protein [Halalkalicoccus jeotgali]|uniref:Chaperone protein dnaJ n=1 Tax=Halalkalicoccus jeotgali (strain DSM 18796 / CECT 7217 / JCM 14584 / KCTC 4019 / B3) TaxID=795797 RepID=D8J8W3_HALJB|nr:J domain-containing protein [Halalkalicoccus jeotgali]ADJ14298.1 chaperone protein dnaJ [Halalkalicoccus jeotgali B3]ELY40560.1 chaperone protein dnaJ [Halalkalicoccus jeotgali B3]
MTGSRLLIGLASVFAGISAAMLVAATVYGTPVPLAIALPFAVTGYLLWYQGTGRLATRIRDRARRPGRARSRPGTRSRRRSHTPPPRRPASGPTQREAYRTLGLDPGAGIGEIKRAYREKVKTTHPDRGGDEEAFKEVTTAYDRLTE